MGGNIDDTVGNCPSDMTLVAHSGTTPVLQVDLGYTTAGGYRLRVRIWDNAGVWNNSAWVSISDARDLTELDCQSGLK